MRTLLLDLRYSARQFIHNPGFTLTAVISLALGIAAATAVFSVVYATLIRPYPYPNVDRIVRLTTTSEAGWGDPIVLNGIQIQQLQKSPLIESVLATDLQPMLVTGGDFPENVNAASVIARNFQDLAVPPFLGRGLLPSDAIDGQEPQPVVVLSYTFWREHYLSDPEVIGRTVQLDHRKFQIVGVAAPRFTWAVADVYLPLKLLRDPGRTSVIALLLRPGVSRDAADAALQPIMEQFAADVPQDFPDIFRVHVLGLNDDVANSVGRTLYLLLGAVILLLLIGCGNVSILLIARGTARQHEFAVRSAIGASRSQIVRQLLTESFLLASVGALLGILTSYVALAAMQQVLPRFMFAPETTIRINLPVLSFSVLLALATGILFGLWPAFRLSRGQLAQTAQSGSRRIAGSVREHRAYSVLIAAQISLTLLLLAGAGSAMKAFVHLIHQPLGFDAHNVMVVGIPLRQNAYGTWKARVAYFEQLRAKIAETPGVTVAAISSEATPPRNGWYIGFYVFGRPENNPPMASANLISPEYFEALRIPLLQGRIWSASENYNGAHVAVINRALAERQFPNGDAIGQLVRLPGIEGNPATFFSPPNIGNSWLQIVGIVENARNAGLRNVAIPAIYVPYTLNVWEFTEVLARSNVAPMTLIHAVRGQLAAVNPDQQTSSDVDDLETRLTYEPEWQREKLTTWIFGAFSWLALVLAAVGLYSVTSYTIAQRMGEFGIRVALGAQRINLLRLVLRSALEGVGGGVILGVGLSLVLNTLISKWGPGDLRDPSIVGVAVFALLVVMTVACITPAHRATNVDPMTTLRAE
jgi:predicted permease